MALERGTSYTVIPGPKFDVGEHIGATDISNIAKNQGYVCELLTGRDASSSAFSSTSTVTAHNHSEDGNRIYRHFVAQQFGTTIKFTSTADYATETNSCPITYSTDTSATGITVSAIYTVFHVPRGHTDQDIVCYVNTNATDPRLRAVLRDSSLATVSGYDGVSLQPYGSVSSTVKDMFFVSGSEDVYGFVFQVTTAGLYTIELTTEMIPQSEQRRIFFLGVVPVHDRSIMSGIAYPTTSAWSYGENAVTVGDPDNSNRWHPLDSNLTAADNPLSSAGLVLMAHNQHLLHELATGLPAPGNDALTISQGHRHGGVPNAGTGLDNADGGEIEYPHLNVTWGAKLSTSYTELFGNRSRAVYVTATGAARTIAKGRIYLPYSVNVNASAPNLSNLKVAVLVECDGVKGDAIDVTVALGGTTKTFRSSLATTGTQLLTSPTSGTNNFAYTANAKNDFTISATMNVVTGPSPSTGYVRAVCAYVDP